MLENGRVNIKLTSVQDGQTQTHKYSGEWFRKERSVYIRYSESVDTGPETKGEVRTLIRYRPDELSITRRGAVQSDQTFIQGVRQSGQYQSAFTSFRLETATSLLKLTSSAKQDQTLLPVELPFSLEWKYKLYAEDQLSGQFHIKLHIQEDPIS